MGMGNRVLGADMTYVDLNGAMVWERAKTAEYLKDCTTPRGGLIYNYSPGGAQNGSECQAITAAACASACSTGKCSGASPTRSWHSTMRPRKARPLVPCSCSCGAGRLAG